MKKTLLLAAGLAALSVIAVCAVAFGSIDPLAATTVVHECAPTALAADGPDGDALVLK
mgnify:CR=1 FL=1